MAGSKNQVAPASEANEDDKKEKKQQFRSSMSGLHGIFAKYHGKIVSKHLEAMKMTPFFGLFECLHRRCIDPSDCRRIDKVSEDIIRAFVPKKRKFKIGGKRAKMTREDVQLIFGIVDGDMPLAKPRLGKDKGWRFCDRIFKGCDQLSQKLVKDKLFILFERAVEEERPDDVEDIVRLICLLAFASLFFPRNSVRLPWGWVEYVESLENMRLYDWSGSILSMLMDSLVVDHKNPYKVKGCTLLPMYWLCEHANIIKVRDDVQSSAEMIPRLVKWHLTNMKDKNLMNIVGDEVIVNALVPTEHEVIWFKKLKKWQKTAIENVGMESDDETESFDVPKDMEDVDGEDEEDFSANVYVDLNDGAEYVSLADDDEVSLVGDSVGKNDRPKGIERELLSVKKKYEELLKKNEDLEQRFGEVEAENKTLKAIEDENKVLKARIGSLEQKLAVTHAVPLNISVPVVDGVNLPYGDLVRRWKAGNEDIKKKDAELWDLTEKVSSLSATIQEMRGEFELKAKELQLANESVADLQRKLDRKTKPRPIDVDEDRWYAEVVEPVVHSITQEFSPEIQKPCRENTPLQNSMVKRIKDKTRKPNRNDDDFVYVNVNRKRGREENVRTRETAPVLTPSKFLELLDKKYKAHCGHYIEKECFAAFVTKHNGGPEATVYYTKEPLVLVTVNQIMDIFKGMSLSSSVIDGYAVELKKSYMGERSITIFSAHCWGIVVKDENQEFLERIRLATLLKEALLLFPVLSTGDDAGLGANHWTLLVFDVHGEEWTFYNSKRNRSSGTKDKYMRDAEKMKAIIEDYLDVGPKEEFDPQTQDPHRPLNPVTALPSQGATNDCGIYTCYFMKHVVMELPLEKKNNTELIKKFKAEIVEALVKPQ